MRYETSLKFIEKDFRDFFEGWITKSRAEVLKVKRSHLITSLLTLGISIWILISHSPAVQLVIVSIGFLVIGIYHLTKFVIVFWRRKSKLIEYRSQTEEYLSKHSKTETFGLEITETELNYFVNGELNTSFPWSELQKVDFEDDHIMLWFHKPENSIFIPQFAVSEDFYLGVTELIQTKT